MSLDIGSDVTRHSLPTAAAAAAAPASPIQRTMNDVRERVAAGVAVRAITQSQLVDGIRIGVALTMSKNDNESYLRHVVSKIKHQLLLQTYLFVVAPSGPHTGTWPLVIFGSSAALVTKAATLACAKFLGRLLRMDTAGSGERWVAYVEDAGGSKEDEAVMWDILRKSSRILDPLVPPAGSRTIAQLLAASRARLERISPDEAYAELQDPHFPTPVVLVDIRPAAQRAEFGGIPQALVVERNVLEWRFDTQSDARLPVADRYDLRVIIICQESYTSSLAAASLHDLGLLNSTDVIGGYKAWKEAGLPADYRPYPS